jgi:plastocyanin
MVGGAEAQRVNTTGRSRAAVLVLAGFGLALAVTAVWLALASGRAAAQQAGDGEIIDFEILVPDAPLTAGDSIEFTNNGERPHTVTDRGNTFDTDAILPGDSGSVTFDAPGTYFVFCRINPSQMNATVVVEEGQEPPSEVRIQTVDPAREGEELSFDPNELEVQAGTEVTVANVGGAPHTLTAEDGSFDTGTIEPGAEEGRFAGNNASFVAQEAGTFNFQCQIHPDAMRGTLTVTGDGGGGQAEPEPPPDEPSGPAAQGQVAVAAADLSIGDFFFDPPEAEVQPGAEVTWTNDGQAPHTATFDDVEDRVQGLDAGEMAPGESASITAPDAPGSYSYFCAIHPAQMRAVLVVAAPGGAGGGGQSEAAAPTQGVTQSESVAPPPEQQVATPTSAGGEFSGALLAGIIAVVLAIGAAIVYVFVRPRPPDPPARR